MNNKLNKYIYLLIFIAFYGPLQARSVHRPKDPRIPEITTRLLGDTDQYSLANFHLEKYPIFETFDKEFLMSQQLPRGKVTFRHGEGSVDSAVLKDLIQGLLKEVQANKRNYTHFKVLVDHNFNHWEQCGLLIVKFKDYPFVLKLFIETPQSFVNPWQKGFEPVFFFYMGGGVNRHLSGLTRIKNLHVINERLAQSVYWSERVVTPRKWFWMPKEPQWLEIVGKNIGPEKTIVTHIPAIYGIVADAIDCESTFSLYNKEHTQTSLDLCNYLDLWIDPHITNFMFEKKTQKIAIVDTEHFPTVVGLKETPQFTSYTSWYRYLIDKCSNDMVFCTKKELLDKQEAPSRTIQIY